MYKNLVKKIDCEQEAIRNVRYNYGGEYCITCGSNKTIKLWNPKKALLLQMFSGHSSDVLDANCSKDSSFICSASEDKNVFYWDVSTSKIIQKYKEHIASVNCVKFNLESSIIISGSVDCSVRLFDCKSKSKQSVQILNEAKDSITSIITNKNQIITASLDGKIRSYDIRKGQLCVDDCKSSIVSLAETQDNQCILAQCLDSKLKLIDKENGQILSEYSGHRNSKYRIDCAFSKNDSIIICGSEDGKVYYWDLLESKLLGNVENDKKKVVHSLSSNTNKDELLTASENFIYLWDNQAVDT